MSFKKEATLLAWLLNNECFSNYLFTMISAPNI